MPVIHYIFDPFCGWCYAAAPLIKAARDEKGLSIQLHAGGMMTGANRRAVTPELRAYVMPHDQRIAQLTGQPFGEAYFEGLLRDSSAVMDSEPPITAILAAEECAGRGLDMLHRLQQAHYVEGRRIADPQVLLAAAVDIGLEQTAFEQAFARLLGPATRQHITESRRLLDEVGGRGFPTLVWEDDGHKTVLDIAPWLGRTEAWRNHLASLVQSSSTQASSAAESLPSCDINGCAT